MRYDFSFLAQYQWVTAALGIGILLFEIFLFPVLAWKEKFRLKILALGFFFHLSILCTMKVFIFSEVMIIFYTAFLRDKDIDRIISLINQRKLSQSD